MFELNLIKDKAKARQRRRVVFLSIVGILFLSGLLSIFVFFALFWRESITLKQAESDVARVDKNVKDLTTALDAREPKARQRRNALIEAYEEDVYVRQDRPYFSPILEDIAHYHPSSAKFWYNSIQLATDGGNGGPRNASTDANAAAKALMGTRVLEANGYVQITASDIVTESDLRQVAKQMDGMVKLVGEPKFTIDVSSEISPGGNTEESRYVPFTMRAAQLMFRSEAP